MNNSPEKIFAEYACGANYKASLGRLGLYEQNRINERFYIGDQWYGASCGNDKPLVRHNVVKRIGDYKIAQLGSEEVSVNYSAEGFPVDVAQYRAVKAERSRLAKSGDAVFKPLTAENEISLMVSALNSYRKTVAERVGLEDVLADALRDAYIRGTGIIYTYFDPAVKTGLFADKAGSTAIKGDIVCQRIKVEDVFFGDPYCEETEKQPFIILSEAVRADILLAQAEGFGSDQESIANLAEKGSQKVTLLTKLFKADDGLGGKKVFAVKVTEDAVVRPEFCLGISRYPLSVFVWEKRDNCAYGESEITHIIPNQIAINRMVTACVWSSMTTGMPLMVVNGDIVPNEITNEPGQIVRVYGTPEEIDKAVKFINPPDYSGGYTESANNLIVNTLTQCGANEAALGDLDAFNTSAIIELREASARSLIPLKNRYFRFVEDIALLWSEFFLCLYGKRGLKISDENGIWYFPFDAEKYKNIVFSASAYASAAASIKDGDKLAVLNILFEKGAITVEQYLKRLPKGMIADREQLVEELENKKGEEQ